MDNYIERKVNGTLMPFDYSGGPPYVHPDSRMRSPLKLRITREQLDGLSTSDAASAPTDNDDSAEDESAEESESTSEGYEEDEAGRTFELSPFSAKLTVVDSGRDSTQYPNAWSKAAKAAFVTPKPS